MSGNTPSPVSNGPAQTREPLFGTILFAAMILFVVLAVAGLAYAGYWAWRSHHTAATQPSITALKDEQLAQKPSEAAPAAAQNTPAPATETPAPTPSTPPSSDAVTKAKATSISVQNGGAAKGSAGVLAEALKTAGYTKVTAGNTLKDYTGTTVYFGSGLDQAAEAVKAEVAKKYPNAATKPADSTNKETSQAPITVILGK